jgi:hypothetical protein
MSVQIPALPNQYGFVNKIGGAHSSRTMMLAELRLLLAACPQPASIAEYKSAIVDENVLLKKTVATRKVSFRIMRELYALDRKILLFRALRDLWDEDTQAQPLLALICAVSRDPLLRSTAESILAIPVGETVTPSMLSEAVNTSFPNNLFLATGWFIERKVTQSTSWRTKSSSLCGICLITGLSFRCAW